MEVIVCPACNYSCMQSVGFYNMRDDYPAWPSGPFASGDCKLCASCGGTGYLRVPDYTIPPPVLTGYAARTDD